MRVVDFHIHVGLERHWNPWVVEFFKEVNPSYRKRFLQGITPEGLIAYLQEQGVERAVVLSEYAPQATGVVPNEFTADFCRGYRELIPFGSLCLYDETPLEEQAERALRELGMRGFKLYPTYAHFYPNDRRLYPFYEVAQAEGVPVMFHTGTSIFKGSRVKYGDPLFLDDVAEDFPNLKIVLEHGGRPFWYDRAAWLITRHRNIYIGIAGIPAKKILEVFPHLERYRDRFIFGSDWPGVPAIRPLWEKILALPISQEAKEGILWRNALRLLGME